MIIDEALILKLERLARLELSAEERSKLVQDLESILTMVKKLDELDTTGIEPLMHLSEVDDILREDVVGNQVSTEEALKNAQDHEYPYFKVPKVITRPNK